MRTTLAAAPVVSSARRAAQPWWSFVPSILGAASGPVTVTANASAHTKGAWVELVASTSADAGALIVTVAGIGTSSTDTATLLDIGVGAASSEVVVIPDVAVGSAVEVANGPAGIIFVAPVYVRRGSRIAARIQSVVTGGKTGTVSVQLAAGERPWLSPTRLVSIGSSTATSTGTAMSASAGTYVELTAATTAAFSGLVAIPSLSTGAFAGGTATFTVAAGPAAAEVDIGAVAGQATSQELFASNANGGLGSVFPADLAPGVRLAAKCSFSSSALDLTLLGIPRTV